MTYRYTTPYALPFGGAGRKDKPQCIHWVPGIFFSLYSLQSGLEKSLHYREEQKAWEPLQTSRQFQKKNHSLISFHQSRADWDPAVLETFSSFCRSGTRKSRGHISASCYRLPQSASPSRGGWAEMERWLFLHCLGWPTQLVHTGHFSASVSLSYKS